jgi:hypothetical protein
MWAQGHAGINFFLVFVRSCVSSFSRLVLDRMSYLGAISSGTSVFYNFTGFQGLSENQRNDYKRAWDWFELVQNSNARQSTLNGSSGIIRFPYITFSNVNDQQKFRMGQFLHQQIYSNDNFQSFTNR